MRSERQTNHPPQQLRVEGGPAALVGGGGGEAGRGAARQGLGAVDGGGLGGGIDQAREDDASWWTLQ